MRHSSSVKRNEIVAVSISVEFVIFIGVFSCVVVASGGEFNSITARFRLHGDGYLDDNLRDSRIGEISDRQAGKEVMPCVRSKSIGLAPSG